MGNENIQENSNNNNHNSNNKLFSINLEIRYWYFKKITWYNLLNSGGGIIEMRHQEKTGHVQQKVMRLTSFQSHNISEVII